VEELGRPAWPILEGGPLRQRAGGPHVVEGALTCARGRGLHYLVGVTFSQIAGRKDDAIIALRGGDRARAARQQAGRNGATKWLAENGIASDRDRERHGSNGRDELRSVAPGKAARYWAPGITSEQASAAAAAARGTGGWTTQGKR